VDEVFHVQSWWQVIFNPSFPYRFLHMLVACLLTAAFLVLGISAWRIRRLVDSPATWQVFRMALVMAAVLSPLQVFIGDFHGLNTLEHQPAKIAAIEAVWETEAGAPFTLFGFPDEESRTTRFALQIPFAASLVLTHDKNGVIQGLNEFEGEHPPVAPVFWAFRIMVGMGFLMIAVSWWLGWRYLLRQKRPTDFMLTVASWMTFSGWVALLAGWYVTEIGRQPWIIYGLLRTSDVVANHSAGVMLGTFLTYVILYLVILVAYISTLRYLSTKPAASLAAQSVLQPPPQANGN
jgi:cytochrome d ubiquinol oxidase subunit I